MILFLLFFILRGFINHANDDKEIINCHSQERHIELYAVNKRESIKSLKKKRNTRRRKSQKAETGHDHKKLLMTLLGIQQGWHIDYKWNKSLTFSHIVQYTEPKCTEN